MGKPEDFHMQPYPSRLENRENCTNPAAHTSLQAAHEAAFPGAPANCLGGPAPQMGPVWMPRRGSTRSMAGWGEGPVGKVHKVQVAGSQLEAHVLNALHREAGAQHQAHDCQRAGSSHGQVVA